MFPSATQPPLDQPGLTPPAAPDPAKGPAPLPEGQRVLAPAKVEVWRRRITAALESTKPAIEDGKTNVARYTGKYLATTPVEDTCLVPTDFYYAESKRGKLFHRLPAVYVKPELPGIEDAAIVFQAALNKKLGAKILNVLPTVKQVIMDCITGPGFGAVAVGYQPIIGKPEQVQDQMTGAMVPNLLGGYYFVSHIPSGDLLVAPEHIGLDFNKSPWVGQRFKEDVPDGDTQGGSSDVDDRRLTPLPQGAQAALRKQRTGYEVWYRAHLFDDDVQHPDKIRVFKVYDDDRQTPVIVRDHPHQQYANSAGKLEKGMRGYGVKPITMRYVPDAWMAPSDASMARNTADELSKGRTQMLQSRDRNKAQWGFDSTRVDKDVQAKIEKNEIQGGIPFNGPGQDATWPITKGDAPHEAYKFNDYAQADLDRIWRLPAPSRGEVAEGSSTATEQQIAATASQEAHEGDRDVFLLWYVDEIAAEVAALMQLYATEQEFVELVGADAQRLKKIPDEVQQQAKAAGQDARVLVPWNMDSIQGLYAFTAKPNSQVFVDAAQELTQMMKQYQFLANSPNVNKAEMERQILAHGGLFDPSRIMQQPPPKQSPPPAVALSVKGEDFNPQMPQAPILLDALSKLGVPIDMAALQAAMAVAAKLTAEQITAEGLASTPKETEHGGAVAEAEPLSKHQTEQTGGMQGSGDPAPMGAGGIQ